LFVIVMMLCVLGALATGCCPLESPVQVFLHDQGHGAECARHRLDVVLLKERDRAPTHSSRDDDVRALIVDETGHLSRLVLLVKGICNRRDISDLALLDVGQDIIGTAPKVMAHNAFETLVLINRNSNSHLSYPPELTFSTLFLVDTFHETRQFLA
jgi:hypothetical protein